MKTSCSTYSCARTFLTNEKYYVPRIYEILLFGASILISLADIELPISSFSMGSMMLSTAFWHISGTSYHIGFWLDGPQLKWIPAPRNRSRSSRHRLASQQIHLLVMLPLPNCAQSNGGPMTKRTYDIRLRNAIARSGDPDLFPDLSIPRSTALQWIRQGVKDVVTHPSVCLSRTI